MTTLMLIILIVVILEHLFFMFLEMFAWDSLGKKVFKGALPESMFSPTRKMMMNQGVYNGFLAAGLIWSIVISNPIWSENIALFFLGCVTLAGIVGALTIAGKIFFIQSLPAIIGIALILGSHLVEERMIIEKEIEVISEENSNASKVMRMNLENNDASYAIFAKVKDGRSHITVTPISGIEIKDSANTVLEGTLTSGLLEDINGDTYPELILIAQSEGSGSYGEIAVFSPNNGISLSPAYLPPLTANQQKEFGYMGHDVFSVEQGILTRKFPCYLPGDSNAKPSGGTVVLTYTLVDGEASRIFKITHSETVKK